MVGIIKEKIMKKILRVVSFVILLCFCASFVSAEDKITFKTILTPISPVFYENNIGIDTPTVGQEFKLHLETYYNGDLVTDISIKDLGGMSAIAAQEREDRDGSTWSVFSLKAPQKEGTFKVVFEGKTRTGNILNFSTDIKVVESDQFQSWMRVGLVAGVVVVAGLAIALLTNRK